MSELYIPPPELYFRLCRYKSKDVINFGHEPEPTLGHDNGKVSDDQWWHLIPGTGKYEGYYLFKSKLAGMVLFWIKLV